MITARLLLGRAHGWECVMENDRMVYLTMVSGRPEPLQWLPEGPTPGDLLTRGRGLWEVYERINHLVPDADGRIGYWCIEPLPSSGRRVEEGSWESAGAGPASDRFLDLLEDLEGTLAALDPDRHWDTVRELLLSEGAPLRDAPRGLDVPMPRPFTKG